MRSRGPGGGRPGGNTLSALRSACCAPPGRGVPSPWGAALSCGLRRGCRCRLGSAHPARTLGQGSLRATLRHPRREAAHRGSVLPLDLVPALAATSLTRLPGTAQQVAPERGAAGGWGMAWHSSQAPSCTALHSSEGFPGCGKPLSARGEGGGLQTPLAVWPPGQLPSADVGTGPLVSTMSHCGPAWAVLCLLLHLLSLLELPAPSAEFHCSSCAELPLQRVSYLTEVLPSCQLLIAQAQDVRRHQGEFLTREVPPAGAT